MKIKEIFVAILVLSLGTLLWCNSLQDHYKKGKITLKAVEDFGAGNDWEELFYDPYKDMTIAPDGSIFVVNDRTNNIFKFSNKGRLLLKFGRQGKGPSDFDGPDDPSILDNKYLVIGEHASNRRFSIWDFNGKCVRVARTTTSVFYLTAIRDNRVAYYYYSQNPEKKNDFQSIVTIIIKDTLSGPEKVLEKITLPDRSWIKTGKHGAANYGNFFGEVFLAQTSDGNLAVGISNQPKIRIFSPNGNVIRSFDLHITPVTVTSKYIKDFEYNTKMELQKDIENASNSATREAYTRLKTSFASFDLSNIFDKYLPLYNEILVDSEGNFLVFKFTECQKDCDPVFQVYSKDGEYICETVLDRGKYDVVIDPRFRKICFTSDGIYGLFMEKGDEDEVLKLIKSNYPPCP